MGKLVHCDCPHCGPSGALVPPRTLKDHRARVQRHAVRCKIEQRKAERYGLPAAGSPLPPPTTSPHLYAPHNSIRYQDIHSSRFTFDREPISGSNVLHSANTRNVSSWIDALDTTPENLGGGEELLPVSPTLTVVRTQTHAAAGGRLPTPVPTRELEEQQGLAYEMSMAHRRYADSAADDDRELTNELQKEMRLLDAIDSLPHTTLQAQPAPSCENPPPTAIPSSAVASARYPSTKL